MYLVLKELIIQLGDIHWLTNLQLNAQEHSGRLKQLGKPEVLTVNGAAEIVVQQAASYQKLPDAVDHAEATEGIRRGLEDMEAGRGRPAKEFFEELREKHNTRGMKLRVITEAPADADFVDIFPWLATHSPKNAVHRVQGVKTTIDSLENPPHRCRLAPEATLFNYEGRQPFHRNYRILTITEGQVHVLHLRYGARFTTPEYRS